MSKVVTAPAAPLSGDVPVKKVAFGVSSQVVFGLSVTGWTTERDCGLTCFYSPACGVLKFRSVDSEDTVVIPISLTKQFVI